MKKYLLPIILIIIAVSLIFSIGFYFSQNHSVVPQTEEMAVTPTDTSWELMQYSKGSHIENLVGTDWSISFDKNDGEISMCTKHPFTYTLDQHTITIALLEESSSSCGSFGIDDSLLTNFFKNPVTLDIVPSPTDTFKKVLTLSHGDEKLVFVTYPTREKINHPSGGVKIITFKSASLVSCPKNSKVVKGKSCVPESTSSQFTIEKVDDGTIQEEVFEKKIITTMKNESVSLSLPFGIYKVIEIGNNTVEPTVFSVSMGTPDVYEVMLYAR